MCSRKIIHFICAVLLLTTIAAAPAAIVGYYPMNEGSGTAVKDLSGKGHDGTINGTVGWVEGRPGYSTALAFPGTTGNYVGAGTWDPSEGTGKVSAAAWIKWAGANGNYQGIVSKGDGVLGDFRWQLTIDTAATSGIGFGGGAGAPVFNVAAPPVGEWQHVAFAHDGTGATIYINGVKAGTSAVALGTGTSALVHLGALALFGAGDAGFNGTIDEVYLCDSALSEAEVGQVMQGMFASLYRSSNPSPADASTDVFRESSLGWTAGKDAVSHDVYLGTGAADVESASKTNPKGVLAAADQSASTYDPPGRLELGRTYYWRVDEVNSTSPGNPTKGNVWSFSVEPNTYAIGKITASASDSVAGCGPENTINGSGLDADDLHSAIKETMWLGKEASTSSWIRYDFDRAYKLDQMWVWNFNYMESMLGFGLQDVTIDYSPDGNSWTKLGDFRFNDAPGEDGYAHNTVIDFAGVAAKGVKITVVSTWGPLGQYGLSEVRFFYVPAHATYPSPASGTVDVMPQTTLSWRPGREAASHKLFLGTDANALSGAAPIDTGAQSSYSPSDLNLGATYYWKVDEVNAAETPATWEGSVWNFSVAGYLVVDDMESYNDKEGTCVFNAWIDGYGTSTNGAIVGLDAAANGTFGSTTIYYAGRQSMPLAYGRDGITNSEATRTFEAPQDWTRHGVKTLRLHFYGQATNVTPVPLWVRLTDQNGKTAQATFGTGTGEDVAALADPAWTTWNVPLNSFGGITLSKVKSMAIGLGAGAGSGTLYIDDIRLYPEVVGPATVTPTLVGQWTLDNDVKDSSGSGNNGTAKGGPTFVAAGRIGASLKLDGTDDYVDCGAATNLNITDQVTLSAWIKPANFANSSYQTFVGKGDHAYNLQHTDGNLIQFYIYDGTWRNANSAAVTSTMNNAWHHVAGTFDGTQLKLYVDGGIVASTLYTGDIDTAAHAVNVGRNSENSTRFFAGEIDEVRIYHGALPTSEIKKLANP